MHFFNTTMKNVNKIAHYKHGMGGMIVDGDGSMGTGAPNGAVVPPTGQWKTNPNCSHTSHYSKCNSPVRRVSVAVTNWTSPWWDTNIKKHYPLLVATDVSRFTAVGSVFEREACLVDY